jgi:hypothetical protein
MPAGKFLSTVIPAHVDPPVRLKRTDKERLTLYSCLLKNHKDGSKTNRNGTAKTGAHTLQ